jgi:transcriptional regulator with XRE-family HTH domain
VAREPADIADARKELGRRLAQLRTAVGYTQQTFAQQVGSTRSTIVNVEVGRQGISRAAWERFDVLLNANGMLVSTFDELSLLKTEWDRIGPVVDLVEDTFGPGARIRTSGAVSDVRDAAVQWLVSNSPRMSPTELDQRQVGIEDVARLQAARDRLKELDNQYGGAVAYPLIADCVKRQVRPLLRGRYKDVTGDPLLRTAAQLILDAGWAAYDADAQPYARRCMRAALRLADITGDQLFGGRILAALAHQSLHVGRNQEAVDLATAALRGAGRIAGPRAVAMFEAMVACAAAAVGDRRSCEAALSRAERALDRGDAQTDVPSWLDFDQGGLAGHAARAYRDLGDPRRARQFAAESIDLCRDHHVRTQVQRKAILAAALAGAGEAEHACAVGQDLLTDARPLRSALVLSDIRKLTNLLGTTSAAGEFRQQVRQLAPSASPPLTKLTVLDDLERLDHPVP